MKTSAQTKELSFKVSQNSVLFAATTHFTHLPEHGISWGFCFAQLPSRSVVYALYNRGLKNHLHYEIRHCWTVNWSVTFISFKSFQKVTLKILSKDELCRLLINDSTVVIVSSLIQC